jgi:cell division protease FtsH
MQTPDDYNNNNDDQNENSQRHFSVGWIYLVAIILIGIFLYFVIQRFNEKSVTKYYDADMTETTDSSGNKVQGELYTILNEDEISYLNVEDHESAGYMNLDGCYFTAQPNGTGKVSNYFTAQINLSNTAAMNSFYSIINSRTYGSGATLTKYYTSERYTFKDYTTQVNFLDYLPSIIIWTLAIIAVIYLVNRLSKSMSSMNSQQFTFNSSRAKRETHSKVRFKDVAGCDEVKAELSEMVDYFHNAKKYTRLGAKLPKGILLQGPPGTGKTLLAKAVAGEADVPFYSISGSDFVEMYVGVGAGRVRDMFRIAKQNAPCLIFIDEIDAVGRQRGAGLGGGNDEREQTLNQLLVEMDGFEENSGVIVMAATNRSDVLDPALLRAGRFDRVITVDLPDKDGREAILKVHSRNKIMSPTVDFGAIASRTVGFSGADLANILNDAAILAVREKKNAIDMDDIDEAIDRSIAGPAKTNRGMSPEEKKRVAYHEAGHAVIGIKLQHSEKVQRITIIPRGRTGGHVLMTPENDRYLLTKEELLAQITGLLGGRTSEEIFFGDISTGASNDIEQATDIAREMVTEYGMSELGPIQYEKNSGSVFLGRDYTSSQSHYSSEIALEIDKAVRKIIDEAHEQAKELLTKYKDDVTLIADTLIDKETITAEQIDYLLANRVLPPKAPETPMGSNESTSAPSASAADKPEDSKPAETEAPQEPKEEKTVNTTATITPEGVAFIEMVRGLKQSAGFICLFVEDENGRDMTPREATKITRDSVKSMAKRNSGLGETDSDKINTCASLFIEKKLWSQFSDNTEDFGRFVEDSADIEVVLIKVKPDSFKALSKRSEASSTPVDPLNGKAKNTADSLKDLVNKDDDKKDK